MGAQHCDARRAGPISVRRWLWPAPYFCFPGTRVTLEDLQQAIWARLNELAVRPIVPLRPTPSGNR